MKKTIITTVLIFLSIGLFSQDQIINGKLTVNNDLQLGSLSTTLYGQFSSRLYFGDAGNNTDPIFISRYNVEYNKSDLRINIGDDSRGDDRFVVGNIFWTSGSVWKDWFVVTSEGCVGIGVSHPSCALDVDGTIRSKEVKIEATGWADFVFDQEYRLPSLSEVENHIKEHKTLPGIPSEQQVKENGVDLGDMQMKLLQKIEELTLYVIDLKKENERQESRIRFLEEENGKLKND